MVQLGNLIGKRVKQLDTNSLLLFCGLLSGTAGLIYQTLWIRVLSLGIGSTSESLSVVVAIFFAGLALGSLFSKRVLTQFHPLYRYAILEGAIGIYAFFLIFALFLFQPIMAQIPFGTSFRMVAKFLLVSVALFPPTFAMGATLPIMVEAYSGGDVAKERSVGLLYGINTLGAVLGALATGYILIPAFGIVGANISTGALNISAALIAFYAFRKRSTGDDTGDYKGPALQSVDENVVPIQPLSAAGTSSVGLSNLPNYFLTMLYLTVGLIGFAAISAEVIWSKYLGIFLGTNIYGLGLVLGLFLSGIAVGSLFYYRFLGETQNKLRLFTILLFLDLIATLFSSLGLNLLPTLASVISYYVGDKFSVLQIKSSLSAMVLFFPTAISGALLPVAVDLAKAKSLGLTNQKSESASIRLSRLYAINTLGSILGSLVTGLLIIPTLGTGIAVKMAIGVLSLLFLIWFVRFQMIPFWRQWSHSERYKIFARIAVLVSLVFVTTLCLAVVVIPKVEFKNIIKSAYFQAADPEASFSEVMKYYSRDYEEFKMIYEGKTAVISLSHDPSDGKAFREYFRLKTNGLNESIYQSKKPKELPQYEALLGFIPFALKNNPQNAFIVGYGGGFTVDLLSSLGIKKVDVAEIEKGILVAANRVFQELGFQENQILKRENVNLQYEDARAILIAGRNRPEANKYDIIVSQPSHSWLSGVANLFTFEFFDLVKSRLSEKGVFSQWLNLYNMDSQVLASILKTFYTVFPEGAVFTNFADQEMIMIGSRMPLSLSMSKLDAMAKDPVFVERLSQTSFKGAFDFISNFTAGRKRVMEVVASARVNTDRNAYAETLQSKLFYSKKLPVPTPQKYLSDLYTGDFSEILPLAESTSNSFYFGLLNSLERLGRYDKFHALMKRYERDSTEQVQRYQHLGFMAVKAQRYATAEKYILRYLSGESQSKSSLTFHDFLKNAGTMVRQWSQDRVTADQAISTYANVLSDTRRYDDLIQFANHLRSKGMALPRLVECYLADAWISANRVSEGDKDLRYFLSQYQQRFYECGAYVDRIVGRYYLSQGKADLALKFLQAYYAVDGDDLETVAAMISAYLMKAERAQADPFIDYYQQLRTTEKDRAAKMVEYYEGLGFSEDAAILQKMYQ